MAGDFTAEYMGIVNNNTVINGTLQLTVYSGTDTSDLAKFFQLEKIDIAVTYTIPVSFEIDTGNNEILSFTPIYTTIS